MKPHQIILETLKFYQFITTQQEENNSKIISFSIREKHLIQLLKMFQVKNSKQPPIKLEIINHQSIRKIKKLIIIQSMKKILLDNKIMPYTSYQLIYNKINQMMILLNNKLREKDQPEKIAIIMIHLLFLNHQVTIQLEKLWRKVQKFNYNQNQLDLTNGSIMKKIKNKAYKDYQVQKINHILLIKELMLLQTNSKLWILKLIDKKH